ncbi:MAG: hypothetical protein V4443_11420 [Pseudomonadota bacterium]
MLFRHPVEDIQFEIPDTWWITAGAHNFYPSNPSYAVENHSEFPVAWIPVNGVQAPKGHSSIIRLDRDKTISLLQAFIDDREIPPIEVHRQTAADSFEVKKGFHRYYISIALGFQRLPITERPYSFSSAISAIYPEDGMSE